MQMLTVKLRVVNGKRTTVAIYADPRFIMYSRQTDAKRYYTHKRILPMLLQYATTYPLY